MPTAVGALQWDTPTIISLLLLLPAIWLYTAYMSSSRFPTLRGARVLLLIAHPDDEAMFFSPTMTALTRPDRGNHVKILCLSNGGKDGLGAVRTKEIRESALKLGIRSKEDVFVLDDPKLQDGDEWDPAHIANAYLLPSFAPGHAATKPSAQPRAQIDALITFDRKGVSGHANHIACRAAALAWHAALMKRHDGWPSPVAVYTLTSVNIVRKYAGALDTVGSVVWGILRVILRKDKEKRGMDVFKGKRSAEQARADEDRVLATEMPTWLLYVSGLGDWTRGLGAMVNAHKSQMVWFRWGWISIGRYMMINELRRIR